MGRPPKNEKDKMGDEIRLRINEEAKKFYMSAKEELMPDLDMSSFIRQMIRDGIEYDRKKKSQLISALLSENDMLEDPARAVNGE